MTKTTITVWKCCNTVRLGAALLLALGGLSAPGQAETGIRWETLTIEEGEESLAFELGHLAVPERRGGESDATIELAFVRIPSTRDQPGPPLVYLSGGPGQAAIPWVESSAGRSAIDALRSLGDVILLDQRGVGRSRPSTFCRWSEPPHTETFLGTEAAAADLRRRFGTCVADLEANGIDVTAYDTRESAHDLEDLRRALGAEKLRLVGYSYGTHLALAAIRYHPSSLDRVVLVGTEGLDHTWKLPSTFDIQLLKLGRLAAADPDVGERGSDLAGALERTMRRLEEEPVSVTIPDPFGDGDVQIEVGPWGLRRILLWDLGDTNDLPVIPALIHQVDREETGLLEWFVAKRYRQMGVGIPAMTVAMDCASGVSASRKARIRSEAAKSLFGNVANDLSEILCPVLGDPELGDSFREPLIADTEVLFVSGTLDANTPPFQAEELRWGLWNARHLLVARAGHEDMLRNPEVFRAIVEFLGTGTTSTLRIDAPPVDFFPLDVSRE